VGIGKSQTKLNGLPFPHTDSVFAVVGEETGLLGSVLLVCLYLVLMWRGWIIARKAPDGLGMLLAGGLAFWLSLEAVINMLVMVGLLPFAGNALPFISAGGSNLLVVMASVGILLNISRVSEKTKVNEEKGFNAVVNLRRGDRRRRVSRPVSPQTDDERES
jgi:cell division protein FtsW